MGPNTSPGRLRTRYIDSACAVDFELVNPGTRVHSRDRTHALKRVMENEYWALRLSQVFKGFCFVLCVLNIEMFMNGNMCVDLVSTVQYK